MMMFVLASLLSATSASPLYRSTPAPGIRRYVYEATETVASGPVHGYRTEFELQTSKGTITAIVRKASVLDGSWKPVEPDAVCRAAMHGDKAALARIKLSPLSPEAARTMGDSFLATCAPAGIFFPLTDILNVVLIPSRHFSATELRKVGQSVSFPGFDVALDRAGVAINESSPGGEVNLVSVDSRHAVLDWKPALADLELVEKATKPPVTLKGTEHFAFRVQVDRKTGAIVRAKTNYDDLDMKIQGMPHTAPDVRITRTVTIELR